MAPAKQDTATQSKSVDLSVKGLVNLISRASPQVFWVIVFGGFWWFVAKPMIDQNTTERNQMYNATAAIDRASAAILEASRSNERSSEYNKATAIVQEKIMAGLVQVSEQIGRFHTTGYVQGQNGPSK